MNPSVGDINRGSNATDFQPETRNPQSDVGGGLQPVRNNLQPVGSQAEGSQQFPSVQQLKVLGVENAGSATPQTPQSSTSNNLAVPIGLILALGLLIFITVAVAWMAKPVNETTNQAEPEPEDNKSSEKPEKKSPKKKKASRKKRKKK